MSHLDGVPLAGQKARRNQRINQWLQICPIVADQAPKGCDDTLCRAFLTGTRIPSRQVRHDESTQVLGSACRAGRCQGGTLASWNIMLRRKKARRLRVLESRRAEEIALDSARSGAPYLPLMQPSVKAPQQSSPSPGTESSNPA